MRSVRFIGDLVECSKEEEVISNKQEARSNKQRPKGRYRGFQRTEKGRSCGSGRWVPQCGRWGYSMNLRRTTPARPRIPLPSRIRLEGSGTAELYDTSSMPQASLLMLVIVAVVNEPPTSVMPKYWAPPFTLMGILNV